MRARIALIVVAASGCFYTEPINQRPSASIIQASSAAVFRGDTVTLSAETHDPDGDSVYVAWRAYTCSDGTTPAGCDAAPYFQSSSVDISFPAPALRADAVTPTESLRVILEATDSHGATAEPEQELLITVNDAAPTVELRAASSYGFAVGTPVDFYPQVMDADDTASTVFLDWSVLGPAYADSFVDTPPLGKELVVSTPGSWDVQVIATDPAGRSMMADKHVDIVPDHPPCLASWAPLAPPAGQTLPMADPTLFEILVVSDDLDPYPPVVGDPIRGTTTFSWSLLPPGASARVPLAGVIGNSVALDPASYDPGDVIELRVEIQDRTHTPVECADSDPTCSVISDPTCIQRLTWTVEVQ
ncbi:MAG TPA: hypothetical protein VMJ10_08080 [Kofleriaceae bacterium]|nr:hypothetical protein [Kofleriaceae bacterium]